MIVIFKMYIDNLIYFLITLNFLMFKYLSTAQLYLHCTWLGPSPPSCSCTYRPWHTSNRHSSASAAYSLWPWTGSFGRRSRASESWLRSRAPVARAPRASSRRCSCPRATKRNPCKGEGINYVSGESDIRILAYWVGVCWGTMRWESNNIYFRNWYAFTLKDRAQV